MQSKNAAAEVLIPLVQGRFLFQDVLEDNVPYWCLNPFGSGTFFIPSSLRSILSTARVLIPLVQGRFLFSKRCFSSFISMGWNGSFQVLRSWKSCCIFTTLVVGGDLMVVGFGVCFL